MHNAYAFAEEPTPYCPFLTGTHKRYVARTHSLCSETSVLRKKCVFTTAPEVSHHAAAPPSGELEKLYVGLVFEALFWALKKASKNYLTSGQDGSWSQLGRF